MGTQNILNYYGNRLDAQLSYSGYYDFYLASDESNFNREVVYSDNIIGYEEPRTPQIGNKSNVLPVWFDLNNTATTMQPSLTGVSSLQQKSFFSGNAAGTIAGYSPPTALHSSGYPQSIISQNYWGQAYSYCDCPYENCIHVGSEPEYSGVTCGGRTGYTNTLPEVYRINNIWLNAVDIGIAPYMTGGGDYIDLWPENQPISGATVYSAFTGTAAFGIFDMNNLDKRFKMWQVSANTQSPSQSGATTRAVSLDFFTSPDSGSAASPGPEDSSKFNMNGTRRYTISSATDNSGYYQQLNGGYYAGSYKYYGYPYSVLPDRPDEGWAMETLLKLRATGTTTGGTCFSTNYNVESNVSVNPGDGCFDYYNDYPDVIETYLTKPMWDTGMTITNTGVIPSPSLDCKTFLDKGGCRETDDGRYDCQNYHWLRYFCDEHCASIGYSDSQCQCCTVVGWGQTPEDTGTTYQYSYVEGGEGDCNPTSCYGMEYTSYDYLENQWVTGRTENVNCTADTRTVNDDFSNNSGFFYYIGTRAENKFHNSLPFEEDCVSLSGMNCCSDIISGKTIGPAVLNVSPWDIATGGTSTTVTMTSTTEDVYSNNLGFRITPDFKIGYRTIRYTGSCETTGGTINGDTTNCNTGDTFVCGYSIEEAYSDVICPSIINSGTCEDTWIQVGVVFERYMPLISGSSCAQSLGNGVEYALGGLLDPLYLFSGITSSMSVGRCDNVFDELPLIPEDGYYKFECAGITGRTDNDCCYSAGTTFGSWLSHDEYRRGDLVFYINGRRHFTVENFEEVIPRALNQHRDLQVGVPFNMSWGGASIGLLENMTLTGCDPVPVCTSTGVSADTCMGVTGFTMDSSARCSTLPQGRCEWTGVYDDIGYENDTEPNLSIRTAKYGDTCGCKWTGIMTGYSWQNIFGNDIVTGDTCTDTSGVGLDGYFPRTGYTSQVTGYTLSQSACTLYSSGGSPTLIQKLHPDADDLSLLIEENFAGTWMGGISQLRYYAQPLHADSMYHNFLVNKDRYNLIDCDFTKNCSKNTCDSSQVLYLTEGNMYDIKAIFGYLSNNLYFTTNTSQVKFRAYTQENVSSIKFYKKYEQNAGEEVTMPVWMNPEDTLEVVIIKMDESLDAIVTLLGNTYK